MTLEERFKIEWRPLTLNITVCYIKNKQRCSITRIDVFTYELIIGIPGVYISHRSVHTSKGAAMRKAKNLVNWGIE